MSRLLGIAAVQMAPVELDQAASFAKLAAEVRRLSAASPQLRLIIFPELFLTGMATASRAVPTGYVDLVAETIPGPLTSQLCALARETGRWLVPGSLMERDGTDLHNTAIAISPAGEIVARYRKLFPWMPYEDIVPGTEHVVFDIPGIARIGLAICYDGWVPEIARTLAWMGAEIIVQPTYTPTADRDQEVVLARANAIANQLYVINPNTGKAFGSGRSVIVDPEGRVLAEAGSGEEVLTLTLDVDLVGAVREYGTAGLNMLWKQLRDFPPPFPPATFGYAAGEIMRGLGDLPTKASVAKSGTRDDRPAPTESLNVPTQTGSQL